MPMSSGIFEHMGRDELINKMRNALKKEEVVQDTLKRHGLDESVLDHMSIRFEPLDVSAKTVDGDIILNEKLLNGEWRDIMRYLVHETCHVGQQNTSDITESQKGDYLDDPNEVEAFKAQVDFMETTYTPEEIQTYLDGLMKHHDVRGKERLQKIRELKR